MEVMEGTEELRAGSTAGLSGAWEKRCLCLQDVPAFVNVNLAP